MGQEVINNLESAGSIRTKINSNFSELYAGGPWQSIWTPASFWIPRTTNGCGVDSVETTTHRQNTDQLLFDAGSPEYAQALWFPPRNVVYTTISARFVWTVNQATDGSDDVVWAIQGRVYSDDDALDSTFGVAQSAVDTVTAVNDVMISNATPAATLAGTVAPNRPIQFQIFRDAAQAADSYNFDARLLGIEILYNTV